VIFPYAPPGDILELFSIHYAAFDVIFLDIAPSVEDDPCTKESYPGCSLVDICPSYSSQDARLSSSFTTLGVSAVITTASGGVSCFLIVLAANCYRRKKLKNEQQAIVSDPHELRTNPLFVDKGLIEHSSTDFIG